jgi:hypothetical protein
MTGRIGTRTWGVVILAVAVALSAVAFGLLAHGGELNDPTEIIVQGLQASRDAESGHLVVTVDGTLSQPDSGVTIALDGTTIEGDFDAARSLAQFTFAVPSLFGLSGEVRVIGSDLYLQSTITGSGWFHQSLTDVGSPSPEPTASTDPEAAIREFLATEGVTTEKLANASCGQRTCYHVRVTVTPEALTGLGSEVPSAVPTDALSGPLVLDLLFDREGLWLSGASINIPMGDSSLTVTATVSDLAEPLEVTPPPADQITEGLQLPGLTTP